MPTSHLEFTDLKNILKYAFFIPSVVKDDTVSLRLGHAPALNVHRTFIHYRRAASLPCFKGRLG